MEKTMTVSDLVKALDLQVLSGEKGLDRLISGGYVSDLLSDVMGHADAGQLWMTLQTHKNVMAIASLKDLAAILLVNGNRPDTDTASQSELEGIPILGSSLEAFEITGKVYEHLKNNAIIQR
jgi:predicted transcriptional regulator